MTWLAAKMTRIEATS